MPQRFVILDRDGTLIADRHYLANPQDVELLPGVPLGLRQLSQLGLGLAVITNQSGVGRGLFSTEQVEQVHQRLRQLLEVEQVQLDGMYFCPHSPEVGCGCRKPKTELVEQAARELGFETRQCFVVGDRTCDIELGRRIGATTFLVTGGSNDSGAEGVAVIPDYVVAGVREVALIVSDLINLAGGGHDGNE